MQCDIIYEYDPRYCQELLTHAMSGKSIEAFCGKKNIPPRVLLSWIRDNEDFSDVTDVAICKRISYWENKYEEALEEQDKQMADMAKIQLIDSRDKISIGEYKEKKTSVVETTNDVLDEAKKLFLNKFITK